MNPNVEINFWSKLDSLISEEEIIIDRPKGSAHPRYPQIIYSLVKILILLTARI